ncbi:heterokaryon incompatibility protein-domain-containing protein [Scleroderma yunnanense]
MRLINVNTVLDLEERRVQSMSEIKILEEFNDEQLESTEYGILSHCWGDGKMQIEVQFREMGQVTADEGARKSIMGYDGYKKIINSCRQARNDRLNWIWVDTCCINKESSSELSEAINSMFRWYENSMVCYAYLHDISSSTLPTKIDKNRYPESDGWPKWFSRGWTLQELIAPKVVKFFNRRWLLIGDKRSFAPTLEYITRVPARILESGFPRDRPSVAQIMSWAADRRTTRVEDKAYSLLGLFQVHLPMIYGEQENAFRRLQEEIIRKYNDHSIFAWDPEGKIARFGSVLADDPSFFRECSDIVKMKPDMHINTLKLQIQPTGNLSTSTDASEDFESQVIHGEEAYSTTNTGIQISLPLKPCHNSHLGLAPGCEAIEVQLACHRAGFESPITIILLSFNSHYYRHFGNFSSTQDATVRFQRLYLAYQDETRFTFKIDLGVPHSGFVRHCLFPDRTSPVDNCLALSSRSDCAITVYVDAAAKACFALVVGHHKGHPWADVICDEPPEGGIWPRWEDYARQVHERMQKAGQGRARRMNEAWQFGVSKLRLSGPRLAKHVHVPRSIRGIQLLYARLPRSNCCSVTINIVQCLGCCTSVWQTLDILPIKTTTYRLVPSGTRHQNKG